MSTRIKISLIISLVVGLAACWLLFLTTEPDEASYRDQLGEPLRAIVAIDEFAKPEMSLGGPLDQLLAIRKTASFGEKTDLLRSLGNDLDFQQQESLLYELVRREVDPLGEGKHSNYFHQICLVLMRQEKRHPRFGEVLATVVYDTKAEPMLRDYSMQHLRILWDVSKEAPSLRKKIEATFFTLSEDENLAASALLSLHYLGSPTRIDQRGNYEVRESATVERQIPDEELRSFVQFALEPERSAQLQLTAIRVVGERELEGFNDTLRSAVTRNKGQSIMVQMAAIALLSKSNDPKDMELIRSLNPSDFRIVRARSLALARWSSDDTE